MSLNKLDLQQSNRRLKNIVHFLARKSFHFLERTLGLHVTPAHFYSPIPTVGDLDPTAFQKVFPEAGLDWRSDQQLRSMRELSARFASEFEPKPNSGLSLVDAFVLYAMIRERKPAMMVEIGAGDTTKISLQALKMNRQEGHGFRFLSVEPYPRQDIQQLKDPDFELAATKVQSLDPENLSEADLLFIDSSHVSKIGSDVNCEILEIVPRMKVGAVIHWHDIVMPMNYPQVWINDGNMFWNESYMVHSFMLFNESFRIVWASKFLRLNHVKDLKAVFPYFREDHHLSSFWIERVK